MGVYGLIYKLSTTVDAAPRLTGSHIRAARDIEAKHSKQIRKASASRRYGCLRLKTGGVNNCGQGAGPNYLFL